MALTSWNTTAYLHKAAAIGAQPFYVSAWAKRPTGTALARNIFSSGASGSAVGQMVIWCNTDDTLQVEQQGAGGAAIATAHPNDIWFHVGGAWIASNSRRAYRNADTPGTNGGSGTPATVADTLIGIGNNIANQWAVAGGLAEVSMWNITGFTTGNIDSLDAKLYNGGAASAGGNPLNITVESAQPWSGKLLAYWPLTSTSDLANAANPGTNNMVMVGTLTNYATHPTIEAVGPSVPTTPICPPTTVSIVP